MKKSSIGCLLIFLCIVLFVFYVLPFVSFKIGKNEYNQEHYVKAFKTLNFSYNMNKNNSDYRYYYALTLAYLKPVLKVQQDTFEISQSEIDDAAKRIASGKVYEWRTNVNYNMGDNYIYNTPSEKGIIRWDTAKFPIKVAIENTDSVPGYYRTEILNSLEQWSNAVNFLKFDVVTTHKNADIVIKISPITKNVCESENCQYIVGFTVPTIKNRILKQMTITLYDKNYNGSYFSDTELFNTVMHEIGHALGIMGHSYYEGDLMYTSSISSDNHDYLRSRNSFQYLTTNDINTVNLLYKLIPDISNTNIEKIDTSGLIYAPIIIGSSNEIYMRKLKEAQAYIEQAPMISGGYVDLAIAYSELGDDENAVKNFEKAINLAKSDEEFYLVYYNLAVQYSSMHKKSKALQYAKKARDIKPTNEVIELIAKLSMKS